MVLRGGGLGNNTSQSETARQGVKEGPEGVVAAV